MPTDATMTVYFLDGTKLSFRYPRLTGPDPATIGSAVKRAIDSDKLMLEVDGDLVVIPIASVKYVKVSPAPLNLPGGVLRKANRN
jgi:hypothetical protein